MMGSQPEGPAARPRVAHFVYALNRRTLATVATVLAAEMRELGCEVAILAVKGKVERGPAREGAIPPGIHAELVGQDSTWRTSGAVPAVRSALRRLAPDVVFAHGNGPIRAAVLATVGYADRPRVVGIEHDHYSSYAWDLPRSRQLVNRLLLPRADVIAGVSGGVADDLESTFPALRGRVALLPPPLTRYADIARLAAEPADHPWFDSDVPVITTVGHVHPRKDHRTLVRAMARLRDVAGPQAARLAIIGSAAPDGEAAAVRALIEELGLTSQVALLGEQRNPLRFVARSTVFALSSRNEGMPVSILEALALGVPVVSTDCPSGPRWILEDGANGLLVPVGDHVALGDAIVHMLGDGDLRARLGAWGPARAADFSPAAIARNYLATAGLDGRDRLIRLPHTRAPDDGAVSRRPPGTTLGDAPDVGRSPGDVRAGCSNDAWRSPVRAEAGQEIVRRPRVVIVQRAIRQYRVPFLERLREELDRRGVELAVLHSTPPREDDRRKDVAAPDWARRLVSRRVGPTGANLLWQVPTRGLWEADLVVVEQASQLLLNYLLLLRRHAGGPLVGFWGHGTSPYRDADRIGEAVKRSVSRQPDWWFAYTDRVVDRVDAMGFPRDRITSVRNATDTRALVAEVDAISDEEVERQRRELGVGHGPVALFIGALVPEKKLEFVVQAGEAIREAVPEFELVIAGDGPMQGWVSQRATDRPWMHYEGQRYGRNLAVLMKLSSFLMVPAWVGLVVTDSFAAGRPLFASRSEAHGPEIEYVVHGVNGLLIDDGCDPLRYAAGVIAALQQPGLLSDLQRGSRAEAARYGVEDMAVRFADGIEEALARGRRQSRQRSRWSLSRR